MHKMQQDASRCFLILQYTRDPCKQGEETEATRHIRKLEGTLAAAVAGEGFVEALGVDVANCRRARACREDAWKQQPSGRRARGAAALILSLLMCCRGFCLPTLFVVCRLAALALVYRDRLSLSLCRRLLVPPLSVLFSIAWLGSCRLMIDGLGGKFVQGDGAGVTCV